MEWYYVDAGQRAGPVDDTEFERLVATGKIQGETLVWRAGMANWQRLREVRAAPPLAERPAETSETASATSAGLVATEVTCIQCGRTFPKENTIPYGAGFICATCKPAFVQRLKEGAPSSIGLNYAGFWIRVGAKLIDVALFMVLAIPFVVLLIFSAKNAPARQPFAQLALQAIFQLGFTVLTVAYTTVCHAKYGATVGKMACGLRVVTPEGERISYARSFGRAMAEMLSGMICDIGYIIAAFDDQKRSLHDHIASTRVIRIR